MNFPLLNAGSSGQFQLPADNALDQRLGLYQVFLKLYEQNRPLLDEILSLEGSNGQLSGKATDAFIQAIVGDPQVLVTTNLLNGQTQAIYQPENIWTIGRDPSMALPIPDRRLSRCQAALQYVPAAGFYLIDLGSTNGSFVNGERVHGRMLLQDGDRIRLSSLTFHFFVCQHHHQRPPVSPEMLAQVQSVAVEQSVTLQDLEEPLSPGIESAAGEPEATCFFLR